MILEIQYHFGTLWTCILTSFVQGPLINSGLSTEYQRCWHCMSVWLAKCSAIACQLLRPCAATSARNVKSYKPHPNLIILYTWQKKIKKYYFYAVQMTNYNKSFSQNQKTAYLFFGPTFPGRMTFTLFGVLQVTVSESGVRFIALIVVCTYTVSTVAPTIIESSRILII